MKAKVLKSQCLFWRTLSDNERTLLTKHLAGASHYRSLTRVIIWSFTEGETQGQVLSVESLCRDHRPLAYKYVCFDFYSLCQSKLTPPFCPPPTNSLSLWKCENPILQMFVLQNSWARAAYSGFTVIAMSWNVVKMTLARIKTIYELASKSWSRSLITIVLIKPHWVSYYKPIRLEKVLCFKILRHFVGYQQGLVKVWAVAERQGSKQPRHPPPRGQKVTVPLLSPIHAVHWKNLGWCHTWAFLISYPLKLLIFPRQCTQINSQKDNMSCLHGVWSSCNTNTA